MRNRSRRSAAAVLVCAAGWACTGWACGVGLVPIAVGASASALARSESEVWTAEAYAAAAERAESFLAGNEAQPDSLRAIDLDGRDFAGLYIGGAVQPGGLHLAGISASVWNERLGDRQTTRMLLTGDVRVRLGVFTFDADQATVWIERVGRVTPGDQTPPENITYQVAVYLGGLKDPGDAPAGITLSGDRLLVTGAVRGGIDLRVDTVSRARVTNTFVREGEGRLGAALRRAAGFDEEPTAPLVGRRPTLTPPEGRLRGAEIVPGGPVGIVFEGDQPDPIGPDAGPVARGLGPLPDGVELPPAIRTPPIFAEHGVFSIGFGPNGRASLVGGEERTSLVVTGGVVVQYRDARQGRSLEITAQRAVVFLPPGGVADVFRADAGSVEGIYLEGDVVATDGASTIRGPKVYYDVQANRAALIDGVFWTFDERIGMPLYVRAEALRQEASNQFSARRATLANSSFFQPHLAIGATDITVTRERTGSVTTSRGGTGTGGNIEDGDFEGDGDGIGGTGSGGGGKSRTLVEASNLTARAGDIPFFYWPRFSGDVENVPLRDVRFGSRSRDTFVGTTWDLYGLLGMDSPESFDAALLVDVFFQRGIAGGFDFSWNSDIAQGGLLLYGIANDSGTDRLSSGARRDADPEWRGMALGEHRWDITPEWRVFMELSWISDERFVDAFFRPMADSRREFANSIDARYTEYNAALSFIVKGSLNDFTPNQYLLQSRGYTVDKIPEVSYARFADDLLGGVSPGLVTWTHEYRAGRMRLNFTEPTLDELGFNTNARARSTFGLTPNDSLGGALRAEGYNESYVSRFDTRQEISMTYDAGPVTLTPFMVGRMTAYDNNFSDFSPDADEQLRLWGALGIRAQTEFERVYNEIDNETLNIHRLRHIIRPNVTAWTSGTNLEQTDLPTYDERVESLASGSAVRFGIDQVFQTKRGGPGRWRDVDVLKLDASIVTSSNDAKDNEYAIGRFYDYRPEYSTLGDYGQLEAVWQVSDAVALAASHVYDFDISQPATTTAGVSVRHTEDVRLFCEVRYTNALDVTYLILGTDMRLTDKWDASARVTFDSTDGELQSIATTWRRRLPEATVGIRVRWNNIREEFGLGVVLEPAVVQQGNRPLDRLRAQQGFNAASGLSAR